MVRLRVGLSFGVPELQQAGLQAQQPWVSPRETNVKKVYIRQVHVFGWSWRFEFGKLSPIQSASLGAPGDGGTLGFRIVRRT